MLCLLFMVELLLFVICIWRGTLTLATLVTVRLATALKGPSLKYSSLGEFDLSAILRVNRCCEETFTVSCNKNKVK